MVQTTLQITGMPVPVFSVGPPQRPPIRHDDGFLGKFPPRKPTVEDYALLSKWMARLEAGEAIQGVPFLPKNDLPDALAAYRHFLFGNGADRTFSYEKYLHDDPSGQVALAQAILQARLGAEELASLRPIPPYLATFTMTSTAIPCGADPLSPWADLYPYPETENWQKAIGAHYLWLSAAVTVGGSHLHTSMTMQLTLHAEDRYNFNPGDEDMATGIPDAENGRFELAGLGHQYTNYGIATRLVRWMTLSSDFGSLASGGPRRHRRPSDNRRLRNQL
jgi:hypothetical protein